MEVFQSETRGHADHGWLKAKHTFSFADYFDPARVSFGSLRVINEDRIAPGKGFGTHPHKDMEIVTYIIAGAIEHKDSMGNGTLITAGEVQRMTAGTGVAHSEFNPSNDTELHLLQIWIFPEETGLQPGYEQIRFPRENKLNQLCLVGSRDGRESSITIHQDIDLYASVLEESHSVTHDVRAGRRIFVQIINGEVDMNGQRLAAGDGAKIADVSEVSISALSEAEFLIFDMGQVPRETSVRTRR